MSFKELYQKYMYTSCRPSLFNMNKGNEIGVIMGCQGVALGAFGV